MNKGKLNITLDNDLIDYVKILAAENRATVSDIITQFLLNLRRSGNDEPMEIIIANPEFKDAIIEAIAKIRGGKMKWHTYAGVFR